MAELIRRDSLLAEMDKLASNQIDGKIKHGIFAAMHLVEVAPEAAPCTGCPKENCEWRH